MTQHGWWSSSLVSTNPGGSLRVQVALQWLPRSPCPQLSVTVKSQLSKNPSFFSGSFPAWTFLFQLGRWAWSTTGVSCWKNNAESGKGGAIYFIWLVWEGWGRVVFSQNPSPREKFWRSSWQASALPIQSANSRSTPAGKGHPYRPQTRSEPVERSAVKVICCWCMTTGKEQVKNAELCHF